MKRDTTAIYDPVQIAPRPIRILLAEDDPEMRRLLVLALEDRGFVVEALGCGARLLERLFTAVDAGADLPDIVVSDLNMPGATGLEALEQVRDRCWATAFILVTAFATGSLERRARDLGAAVLAKPFALRDLRNLVEQGVGRC